MRGEIKPLTSLRGLAAMAVVAQHFSATAQTLTPVKIPSLVPHGYMAVDFFFVLSGFIMCYTYIETLYQPTWRSYGEFLQKRVARIFPLHAFAFVMILLLAQLSMMILGQDILIGFRPALGDVAGNALMVQGLGLGRNLNGPSWSVSCEFVVYFFFPILIAVMFRASTTGRALAIVAALVALGYVAAQSPRLDLGADDPLHGMMRCAAEFTLGMGAYHLSRMPRFRDLWANFCLLPALYIGSLVLLVLRIDLLLALLFPILIAATALDRGRLAALLSWRVPHFLGVISYSIYLIHGPFRPIEAALVRALHPDPVGPGIALMLAAIGSLSVIPAAWLTYAWVERPARSGIRRLFHGAASRIAS